MMDLTTEQQEQMVRVRETLADDLQRKAESAKRAYDESLEKFLVSAATNPAYAIEWGEGVVMAQTRWTLWAAGAEALAEGRAKSVDEALAAVVRMAAQQSMRVSRSTGVLTNGVEQAKTMQAQQVLREAHDTLAVLDDALAARSLRQAL